MTRVYHRHAGLGAQGNSTLDRARAVRKKKPYKVVMEVVTQEKKKLQSIMSYSADAPHGYTFVPLGNRDLTEYCKERCRKRNLEVHIVSAKPKGRVPSDPDDESAPRIDTQRIGHHFPNAVIDEACDVLGYYFRNGVFQKSSRNYEETRLARSLHNYGQRMQLHGHPATETQTKDQVRSAILEVFPKIPENDLNAIVKHAFEEGTKRVGNATDLTLARRVQLAVGAYIRHQYTDYDSILKNGGTWPEARQKAQPLSYAKLKEWRDEADNSNELEETFREIIVLDDDDDGNESDTSEDSFSGAEREHSLEIFSSRATARELQPEDPASYMRADATNVIQNRRRRIILQPVYNPPRHSGLGSSSRAQSPRHAIRPDPRAPPPPHASIPHGIPQRPDYHDFYTDEARPRYGAPQSVSVASSAPQTIRGTDGRLYNLLPIQEPSVRRLDLGAISSPSHQAYQNGYGNSHKRVKSLDKTFSDRPAPLPMSRRPSGEETILPSIEREPEGPASPRYLTDSGRIYPRDNRAASMGYSNVLHSVVHSPQRKVFPLMGDGLSDHVDNQAPKRLRSIQYDEPVSPHNAMFRRLHDRGPAVQPTRPRLQPERDVINLMSSPHRVSDRSREVYPAPSSSYAPIAPTSRSYITEPGGHYTVHRPEYDGANEVRHVPRPEYSEHADDLRSARPATYVVDNGRYMRSGVQYPSRALR